jgi:2-hydroxychromene-2-carboxylate isomerase
MTTLEFWYEFASPYSYLSAMRIERLAAEHGVEVAWKPFLLGPIFKEQGWETSPFNLYPAKGRHMVRDMERIAVARGLDFTLPEPFPQQGIHAARLAFLAARAGWGAALTKEIYLAEFAHGRNIGDTQVLASILEKFSMDSATYLYKIATPTVKEELKAQTDQAMARGIFGAPSFITPDNELFWGDDRLEQALAWCIQKRE